MGLVIGDECRRRVRHYLNVNGAAVAGVEVWNVNVVIAQRNNE